MRRARRGAQAVEFALTLPVFSFLISGVVDYGRYFDQEYSVEQAAWVAVRTTASTDTSDGPAAAGEAAMADALDQFGLDCGAADIDCGVTGSSPNMRATCSVELDFTPYVGLMAVPHHLGAEVTMRFDDQDT